MADTFKSRVARIILLLIFLSACALGVNSARLRVGGIRHLTSPNYWKERIAGTDLYQPEGAMLKHGSRELPEIALTFDDGPHPASLPLILDTLRQYGVRATFFLVGKRIAEHPDLARQIVEAGHEVGNHTMDHRRLTALPLHEVYAELEECEAAFEKAAGRPMYLFRPPGMRFNPDILRKAEGMGYVTVGWSAAAKDFETESHRIEGLTPDQVADRVLKTVDNGGIILLHDTKQTAEALPRLISVLRVSGYRFVTVPEMLSHLPHPVLVKSNAGAWHARVSTPRSR